MEIGKNYFFRTDTDHWVGRLVSIDGPYTVTITDFAYVADSGRLSEFLAKGRTGNMEIEAAPDGMNNKLNWRSVIDWPHPLLRETV